MVGVALSTFHAAATIFAFNFLSDNNGQPSRDHVESIRQALNEPKPNHNLAKQLWNQINFPLKNESQSSDLFLNHWFNEILHKSRNINNNRSNDVSKQAKEMAKFVHLSVNSENKAKFYAQILNNFESYKITRDDAAFTLGKFALLDKVQNHLVEENCDFVDSVVSAYKTTLSDMFSPVIWSVLRGGSSLLKNRKFGSYLYVGEIPGKGSDKQVLLWNSPQFVNIAQALFNFTINGDLNDSQTRFKLLQRISQGNSRMMTTNEVFFREDVSKRNASSLSVTPLATTSPFANKAWRVELIRDTNSVRIVAEGDNEKGVHVLCAPSGREFEIDELRRKAGVMNIPKDDAMPVSECIWDIVEV